MSDTIECKKSSNEREGGNQKDDNNHPPQLESFNTSSATSMTTNEEIVTNATVKGQDCTYWKIKAKNKKNRPKEKRNQSIYSNEHVLAKIKQ